jgi:hypothetical protein
MPFVQRQARIALRRQRLYISVGGNSSQQAPKQQHGGLEAWSVRGYLFPCKHAPKTPPSTRRSSRKRLTQYTYPMVRQYIIQNTPIDKTARANSVHVGARSLPIKRSHAACTAVQPRTLRHQNIVYSIYIRSHQGTELWLRSPPHSCMHDSLLCFSSREYSSDTIAVLSGRQLVEPVHTTRCHSAPCPPPATSYDRPAAVQV